MSQKGLFKPSENIRFQYSQDEQDRLNRVLAEKLPANCVAVRPGPGRTNVAYIESHRVIEMANAVFGFNGWSCQILDLKQDFFREMSGGQFIAGYTAMVRILLRDGTSHEDIGEFLSSFYLW